MCLVRGAEGREAPDHPLGVLPQNLGAFSGMLLRAADNDRRKKLAPSCYEFRIPLSDTVDQTDHLIGTSARAPQRPIVIYTGMGTVGPGPHRLLRH
ncbi:hypothetical protein TNCV_1187191 [Trichonephila clavipes]|nr:hypothetical protein TNCV_1187191 [Trichonephila clavipes]